MDMKTPVLIALVSAMVAVMAANSLAAGFEVTTALNLENVTTTPSQLYPGSSFVLAGTVRNIADRDLFFIRVTAQGGFPFSKTSPLTSFYIDRLVASQTFQFSIPLSIDKDAASQQYTLQITGQYAVYDSSVSKADNVINSQTMSATVKVDKGVDLEILNVTFPQRMVPDLKDGRVVLYVQNNGINSAEQVQFNLAAGYPFMPTGRSYFVDRIPPGETRPVVFHIDVDSSASVQDYPMDMTVKWKEGSNQYTDIRTFGIPVESAGIGYALPGWLLGNTLVTMIASAGLLAAVFIAVARRRAKKKK